jgi:hypothetical protein
MKTWHAAHSSPSGLIYAQVYLLLYWRRPPNQASMPGT